VREGEKTIMVNIEIGEVRDRNHCIKFINILLIPRYSFSCSREP